LRFLREQRQSEKQNRKSGNGNTVTAHLTSLPYDYFQTDSERRNQQQATSEI
jgi:hypothetical protein